MPAGARGSLSGVEASIQEIAKCKNVVVKLGGLRCRLLGYDFHLRPEATLFGGGRRGVAPYIETCIEAFGPDQLHVRKQFSAGQRPVQLSGDLHRLQGRASPRSEARRRKTALFSRPQSDFLQAQAGLIDGRQ